MEYRKFDNIIIARIDKGEEILEQLKAIAITENIKLASINVPEPLLPTTETNSFSLTVRLKSSNRHISLMVP